MGDMTFGTANHVSSGFCKGDCKNRDTEKCKTCFKIKGKYTNYEEKKDEV